jgi:hypothetical protein
MSKSFSNTPYNVKSMNGIITLSDGAGTTIENGQITTKDINSSGKITAIEIEATEVLFNDDLDMNGNDILNVNDINTTLINGSAYPPATADTLAEVLANGNSAGTNDIDMNGQNITNVTNINGASYPPTETLAQILTNGNSAGTTDLDMNSQNILNVTNINGSAYPPPSSVDNLADTLLQGNSAGATSIDMNSQDLQNVDELQVDNITGRNGAGNEIRLNSDINVNGNDFQNCNFINFSAFTGALFCPNDLQIQAGTVATAGNLDVVLGHSTSQMNITGGSLDMNNNQILNCPSFATQLPEIYIHGNPSLGTTTVNPTSFRDCFIGAVGANNHIVYTKIGNFTDTGGNQTNTFRIAYNNQNTTSGFRKMGFYLPSGTYKFEMSISNITYGNYPSDTYGALLDINCDGTYINGNSRGNKRFFRGNNTVGMGAMTMIQIVEVPDGDAVIWRVDAGTLFNPKNITLENFHFGFKMIRQGNWNGQYRSISFNNGFGYNQTVDN